MEGFSGLQEIYSDSHVCSQNYHKIVIIFLKNFQGPVRLPNNAGRVYVGQDTENKARFT